MTITYAPESDLPQLEYQRITRGVRWVKGWTQGRLGAEFGVSAHVVHNWEHGRTHPGILVMPMLRAMLNGTDQTVSAFLLATGEIERSARLGDLTAKQASVLKATLEQCLQAIVECEKMLKVTARERRWQS